MGEAIVDLTSLDNSPSLVGHRMEPPASSLSLSGLSQPCPQVPTCIHCRQRRIKCDRQLPRCSNCLRLEVDCVYPSYKGRAPKKPRRNLAPQLVERLSRLESIVGQFGAAVPDIREASKLRQDSEEHSFDQDFSRLKVDESKSYYVNNALWVTLTNEVEELRDLLFEPASEDAGFHEPSITPFTTTASTSCSYLGLNTAILGHRVIPPSLTHYHPSSAQAVALFAAFTENVAPLVRIFHMPTLTELYWNAMATPWALDKHLEALLFAIHYSAVISLNSEQCPKILGETREAALGRYRFAVEQALAKGNLLSTQSMTMLQAAVLFLSALPNEDDSRAAWALTSLVFHIARTMGLHRDGTVFGLKPFDRELRRRIWWQICIIDSRSSEYHCNEPIAQGFIADTKPPLHIDDIDLSPGMVQCPAERWDRATDMTLTLIRCEAIQTGWKLGRLRHKQTRESTKDSALQADQCPDFFKQRQVLIQGLETSLHGKYLPICDDSVPFQLLSSAVARIILGRFWLITQYSVAPQEKESDGENVNGTEQMQNELRDMLFEASIGILEVSGMLLTNKEIMHFYWYSKTHIQWGAMTFVLSELCSRSQSIQCNRGWSYATTVYEAWRDNGSGQDETRLALWRPIRRLMAKARYVRELQQTDPGQPSKNSCRIQRPGSRPSPRSLESFSQHAMSSYFSSWPGSRQPNATSMVAAKPPLSNELPASGFSGSQTDALQDVLGADVLDPFMNFVPEWPWIDVDQMVASTSDDLDFAM